MVTATHDRRRDPRARVNTLEDWGQRSVFGAARGWPWWGAVLLALGLSIVGAFIDMHTSGNLSKVFEGAYFLGCVGAVCLVRRRSVFGPMVEPPLILAVTIPVVVLLTKGMPAGSGLTAKLLALGVPLVTGFPTMAITTGATVVIGGIRYLVQRKPILLRGDDEWDEHDDRAEARRRPTSRGAAERATDRDGGRERPPSGRPRLGSGGSGGRAAGKSSRSGGDGQRERGRAAQSNRGRGESSGRDDRSGRSSADRDRGQGRDQERRSSRDRSSGDRSPGDRSPGDRSPGDRSPGDRSPGDRKPGDRSLGERGPGDRKSGERGQGDRGQGERGQGERGQASRGQSRDRGQAPRGSGRPSRDDGRRQPPRRREDDR